MRIVWTLTVLLVMTSPAAAQPSNQYLLLEGHPVKGYIEIPADVLLETPEMTVEAWVSVRDAREGACSSIAGNGYRTGWWLGLCGTSMRSYFNGLTSAKTGGIIADEPEEWVHIAAVTDGLTRRHYINAILVYESAETAPESTSTQSIRIGSDPDWDYMIQGRIDDLRIWKVARTATQIRQTMYARYVPEADDVNGRFQSLEAWYRFEGDAMDSWRTHHGTIIGTGIGFEAGVGFRPPGRRRSVGH